MGNTPGPVQNVELYFTDDPQELNTCSWPPPVVFLVVWETPLQTQSDHNHFIMSNKLANASICNVWWILLYFLCILLAEKDSVFLTYTPT